MNENWFDPSDSAATGSGDTAWGTASTPAATAPTPTFRPPSWILGLSLVVSLTGPLWDFLMSDSSRLIGWLLTTVGITLIAVFLILDQKKRGRAGYTEYSSDIWLFRGAVSIGLICVIITSVLFGLQWGR
ncbi:MAG: hypothetical protein Q4P33_06325 [Flaviflexus sp.]|nr:hypothetical protein [Flaviflexus sp.]